MHYSNEALNQLNTAHSELRRRYKELIKQVFLFAGHLKNERAKEHMLHGVGRRLKILQRCVDNIFRLFPAGRMEKLPSEDLLDLEINLHAFLINTYGVIENIALALAYENNLMADNRETPHPGSCPTTQRPPQDKHSQDKVRRNDVNLFKSQFQRLLNRNLSAYLREGRTRDWYRQYAKNYRDALAHRIPPYVPPAALNDEQQRRHADLDHEKGGLSYIKSPERIIEIQHEQASLGTSNPLFMHSFSEAKPLYLHPQLIADFRTVEELVYQAIANFHREGGDPGRRPEVTLMHRINRLWPASEQASP